MKNIPNELLEAAGISLHHKDALLIINCILDRFDAETTMDRTTAFSTVLDHMIATRDEGANFERMIGLLELLLLDVLREESEWEEADD